MADSDQPPTGSGEADGPGSKVRRLTPSDVSEAAGLLARGFAEEPASVSLFPDPGVRSRLNEVSLARALRRAMPAAAIHGVEDGGRLAAIAIWHPPGLRRGSLTAELGFVRDLAAEAKTILRAAPAVAGALRGQARRGALVLLQRRRAITHASRGSAWYLAYLAVDPAHQGKGHARRLLEHQLRRCDLDALPAWLETTEAVNPPFYARFGFEVMSHIEDTPLIPALWVLRREPRPVGHQSAG